MNAVKSAGQWSREAVLAAVRMRLEPFTQLVRGVAYERKGILNSELLFFDACATVLGARRIIESGRARGQSTLVLSLAYPERRVLSIEYDRNSPDVAVAARRLAGRSNVELLFGDATQMLPGMVEAGDVVLIDGPKGFRAVRLALRLLASGRVLAVCLHDVGPGTAERAFLQRELPEALFSDDSQFAGIGHVLDADAQADIPDANRWRGGPPAQGYGFSLGCLPWQGRRRYRALFAKAVLAGLRHRWTGRRP